MKKHWEPLRPFWRYYGGKWRSVSRGFYPPPQYGTVIESFAGAAGYACHYWPHDVVLCERDNKVAAIWRWLIAATPADVLALPPVIDRDVREYGLTDAETWFLGFWCGSALGAPRLTPSKWRREYAEQAWNPDYRARIAGDVLRIKHWTLIEGDYSEAPDVAATWFVDPPYKGKAGRRYRTGSSGLDFSRLADWCRSRRGQTIVCEASGATWLPFQNAFTMQAANTSGRGKTDEAVWQKCESSGMLTPCASSPPSSP